MALRWQNTWRNWRVPVETLCSTPPGLQRSLAFVQDNRREFMEGIGFGLSRAAADSGLAYSNIIANDDAALMIEQMEALHADAVGAIVVAPIDPRSLTPSPQAIIAQGTYVGAVVPPPAVTILNAPQYLTGKTLAQEAGALYRGSTRRSGQGRPPDP